MFYTRDQLPPNRSIPATTVIPVLPYPDVRRAVAWLGEMFGFKERLQIADHRAQLVVGDGAIIVAEYIGGRDHRPAVGADHFSHLVMVRIPDVNAHYEQCRIRGAEILQPPIDHVYGERQYEVKDIGGHRWSFSQTLSDSDPGEWGEGDVLLKM